MRPSRSLVIITTLALSLALLGGGCTTAPAEKPAPKPAEQPPPSAVDTPAPPAVTRRHIASTLERITEGAKAYFTSEHKYEPAEPWHKVVEGDKLRQPGFPVRWSEYVFPGGEGFVYSSTKGPGVAPRCEDVPTDASTPQGRAFDLQKHAAAHPVAVAALKLLRHSFDPGEGVPMLIGYETGPERGPKATATVTIMVNHNPKTPECHTERVMLFIDAQSLEVLVSKPTIEHANE